ncbi:uncharacterized protein ACIB01_001065 [Guaruba guarouba]
MKVFLPHAFPRDCFLYGCSTSMEPHPCTFQHGQIAPDSFMLAQSPIECSRENSRKIYSFAFLTPPILLIQNRCCLFPFSCIYMEMCFHSEDALRGFFGSLHQLLPTTMSHQAWPQGEKMLLVSLLPATPDFSILLDPSLAIAFLVILNALFELFGAELLSRMQIIR